MSRARLVRNVIWGLATLVAGEAVLERDLHDLGGDSLAWLARIVAGTVLVAVGAGLAWPAAARDRWRELLAELGLGAVLGATLVVPLVHSHRADVARGAWLLVGVGLGAVWGLARRLSATRVGRLVVGGLAALGIVLAQFGSATLAHDAGTFALGRARIVVLGGVVVLLVAARILAKRLEAAPAARRTTAPRPGPTLERALLGAPGVALGLLGLARARPAALMGALVASVGMMEGLWAVVQGDVAGAVPAVGGILVAGAVLGAGVGAVAAPGSAVELLPVARARLVRAAALGVLPGSLVVVVAGWLGAAVPRSLGGIDLLVAGGGLVLGLAGLAGLVAAIERARAARASTAVGVVAPLAGSLLLLAPAVQANVGLAQPVLLGEDVVAAASFAVVLGLAAVSFVSWWQGERAS